MSQDGSRALAPAVRIALVTGAASGMGRAFAVKLAARGWSLLLLDVNRDALDETVRALPSATWVRTLVVDIGSADAVAAMVASLDGEIDRLDLLINCAGILGAGSFAEQPVSSFAKVIQVNLMGTVHLIHATLPWLRVARGQIVNLASTASLHGWPMLAAYSAAKGAIENFSESIRAELARDGIGVTVVFPLLVDTPMLRTQSDLPPILRGGRISADSVVESTLRGAERRRRRVYVPFLARLVAIVHGLYPRALDLWGARMGMPAPKRLPRAGE